MLRQFNVHFGRKQPYLKNLKRDAGGNRNVIENETDSVRRSSRTGGVGRVICQQRQVTQERWLTIGSRT